MLIQTPNQIAQQDVWAGLIYGEPGTGKSTLALSAPNPVVIDSDQGMKRVQKRFQAPSLQMTSYQQVLDLLGGNELASFETIIIDTFGKFIDLMGDYVQEQDPKNRKRGGGLSQHGYGSVKTEFQRVLRLFRAKKKYLLFVAHGREEKDGDVVKIRPDVSGSSGKDLVKDLDFMGYMEMRGDNIRTISFNPSERFYAKNSLQLPAVMEVPDPNVEGNVFIQRKIIDRQKEQDAQDRMENEKYEALMALLLGHVEAVSDAETANLALEAINKAEVMWDSQRQAKHALQKKVKELGLSFDKEKKAFLSPPKEVEDEANLQTEQKEVV